MNGKIAVLLTFILIAAGLFSGLTIWANKPRGIRTEFMFK